MFDRSRWFLLAHGMSCLALMACGDDETASSTAPTGPSTAASTTTGGRGGAGGTEAAATTGAGGATTSTSSSGGSSGAGGSSTTACSTATCDIDFSGSGFGAYDGKTITWGLVEQGSTQGAVFKSSGTVNAGTFSFSEMDVTTKNKSYFLNYYIDANDNGSCDINGDAVFRISLSNVQTHHQIHVVYEQGEPSNLGCGGLNE